MGEGGDGEEASDEGGDGREVGGEQPGAGDGEAGDGGEQPPEGEAPVPGGGEGGLHLEVGWFIAFPMPVSNPYSVMIGRILSKDLDGEEGDGVSVHWYTPRTHKNPCRRSMYGRGSWSALKPLPYIDRLHGFLRVLGVYQCTETPSPFSPPNSLLKIRPIITEQE